MRTDEWDVSRAMRFMLASPLSPHLQFLGVYEWMTQMKEGRKQQGRKHGKEMGTGE